MWWGDRVLVARSLALCSLDSSIWLITAVVWFERLPRFYGRSEGQTSGELEGSGSAGAEEAASSGDCRVEVRLHGLCGLTVLRGLEGADGDVPARVVVVGCAANVGLV